MEYWEVFDENGRPTGKIVQKGYIFPEKEYHPAMEAWIVNPKGEILIQQRSMRCELLPGHWALTTGRLRAGESSFSGCIREVYEELGLRVCTRDLTHLRRIFRGEHLWDLILVRSNVSAGDLRLDPDEVAQARWVTSETFEHMLDEGTLFKYPEIRSVLRAVIQINEASAL